MKKYSALLKRIEHSKFRSSFHLREKEKQYALQKGREVIERHAYDFVSTRLSESEKDGSQTPMKGHPVFVAQHATGTCCRGCLEKWHRIPKGSPLTEVQKEYVVSVLMAWIEQELTKE